MKEVTEQGAFLQLSALCARAEHCEKELCDKMLRWGMDAEAQSRVMSRLVAGRFVDDERYARAFVNDKVKYNKWGRRKVDQALWQKGIGDDIRRRVLDEVPDEQYLAVLRPLLAQKRSAIKASSDYELKQKMLRFALSRGFDYELAKQCLGESEE